MQLFDFERRWVDVLGRALLPVGAAGGTLDDADRAGLIAVELERSPIAAALLLRLSIWLLWFAPLVMAKGLHTFGRLDEASRDDVLERLFVHRNYELRMIANFFKLNLCALVLGERRFLARLGAYGLTDGETAGERLHTLGAAREPGRERAS